VTAGLCVEVVLERYPQCHLPHMISAQWFHVLSYDYIIFHIVCVDGNFTQSVVTHASQCSKVSEMFRIVKEFLKLLFTL